MKASNKMLRWVSCLGLLVGLAFGYSWWWLPNKRIGDLAWLKNADDKSQRETAHQVLRLPGRHHDAFILLGRVGDNTSIPYLISALRWQRDITDDGIMECTKAHCLEALRRITGTNVGADYEDWAKWQRQNPRPIP
jgi:hypothetical protein